MLVWFFFNQLKSVSLLLPGRCARCGENVVGEGTGCTAMDQVFHVNCFTCMICHNKLRGQPFYAMEKKAYCEPCYIVSSPPPRHAKRGLVYSTVWPLRPRTTRLNAIFSVHYN
uniref:LIM zinc-binding domain-containing protein n=1 Tax=Pseudonaja textilis TaxID=8673 RepID=A0A670Z675_PSETE